MSRIAIIGGHGKVALKVSRILSGRGHLVTSVIRNADQIDEVEKVGGDPVVVDVEQASVDEMAAEFEGHEVVIWMAGAGGGSERRTYAVDRDAAKRSIDAAAKAGVKRFVMLSYLGSRPDHGVPPDDDFHAYAEAKAAADAHVRASTLDWTILAPGRLTDDPPTGMIGLDPAEGESDTGTSRSNVAVVAAEVLKNASTIGKTVRFVDGDIPIANALRNLG